MPAFLGWSTSSFVFVGPDPFPDSTTREGLAYNTTTIELRLDAVGVSVDVSDDDPQFHDQPFEYAGPQTLAAPVTLDGTNYLSGDAIWAEYRYVLRDAASSDPADNFSIIVFRIDGDIAGVASTAPMSPGETYQIVSGGSDNPDTFFSSLAQPICLTPGTLIETPNGPCAIEALRRGDSVTVRDGGTSPILWIDDEVRLRTGRAAPVRVAAG